MGPEATHLKVVLADAASATAAHASHNVADFSYGSVQLSGTFVASVQLEVSNDGLVWANLGAAITTVSITEKNFYSRYIRANITWTSGTSVTVTLIAKR